MKTWIRIAWLAWVGAAATLPAPAQSWKIVRTFDWQNTPLPARVPGCRLIRTNNMSVLVIQNTNGAALEVSLLSVTNPAIIRQAESISVEMKFADVQGLVFENTNQPARFRHPRGFETFVSGALKFEQLVPPPAPGGDESTNEREFSVEGTSNWRPYEFGGANQVGDGLPLRLELRLFLPTNGTVWLRPIKVMKYATGWWSPEQAGWFGGIGGSVIGCFAGLVGGLAGMGKARRFVLFMTRLFIGLGIALTIAGVVAAAAGQASAVWYALLLPGGILTLVFWVNLYPIKKRYDDMEIRRMASVDTMKD